MGLSYNDLSAILGVADTIKDIATSNKVSSSVSAAHTEKHEYHREESVAGVSLENYLKREADEDDSYVKVTSHEEWIEKVPAPPIPLTPEQQMALDKRRAFRQKTMAVFTGLGILVGGAVAVVGMKGYNDRKAFLLHNRLSTDFIDAVGSMNKS